MAIHWKRVKKTKKVTSNQPGKSFKPEKFKEGINTEDLARLENEGGSAKPLAAAKSKSKS